MKVGTDSIMLGSWVKINQAKRILDIGTGSGLLAIMLAQKCTDETAILGIDIDKDAVAQATKNMLNSPWPQRLNCQHVDITKMPNSSVYELIVSNPPYFKLQMPSTGKRNAHIADQGRRTARHHSELDLASLFSSVTKLLGSDGHFYCILPYQARSAVITAQRSGLYCNHLTEVHSVANKPPIRQLLHFSRNASTCQKSNITIHQSCGQYSEEYKRLCRDFYLTF